MTTSPTRPASRSRRPPTQAASTRLPLALMGDALSATSDAPPALTLTAQAPRTRSLVRLYKDGRMVAAARGGRLEYAVREPGVYRVEVFLYKHRVGNVCIGAKPWIFSNPIYVQPAAVPTANSAAPGASGSAAKTGAG